MDQIGAGARVLLSFSTVILIVGGPFEPVGVAGELIDGAQIDDRGLVLESSSYLGWSNGLGDINGDGFDDIGMIVQVPPSDGLSPFPLMIVYGRAGMVGRHPVDDALQGTAIFQAPLFEDGGIGKPNSVGDVNGDGLGDFSFPYYSWPIDGDPRGLTFLVYGDRNLSGEIAVEEIGRTVPGLQFFSSDSNIKGLMPLTPIGDFNGDGAPDFAIGAQNSTNPRGEIYAGAVFVLFDLHGLSSPVDLKQVGSAIPGLRIDGTTTVPPCCTTDGIDSPCCQMFPTIGELGGGIRAVGDIDGDGFHDFLVTASELRPRRVYLIRGGARLPPVMDLAEADSLSNVITFMGPGPGDNRSFAMPDAMTGLGDLNGDGFDDFAIGITRTCCPSPTSNPTDGGVYIFYGRPDFPQLVDFSTLTEDEYSTVIRSKDSYSVLGSALAASDLNHDGAADLVIGEPQGDPHGRISGGKAYVVYGKRDFPKELILDSSFDGFALLGETTYSFLGYETSAAGDFNGDGNEDVLIGARKLRVDDPTPLRVYLLYGTGSGPQPLRLNSISPAWGSLHGGTEVLLNGSGFEDPMAVFFGDRPAASLRRISSSQLTVITPASSSLRLVDITVHAKGETESLPQAFEYIPHSPAFEVKSLGDGGFILEGIEGSVSLFTYPAISAIAFGDLDGDEQDDLVAESTISSGWTLTVVRGGPDLPPRLPMIEPSPLTTTITTSEFRSIPGATVTFVGNVDGDGGQDLAIGASDATGYLLFGGAGLPASPIDIDAAVEMGSAVRFLRSDAFDPSAMPVFAPVGDLTGDGVDDFAVGFNGAAVTPDDSSSPGPVGGEIRFLAGRRSWPKSIDLSDPAVSFARIHGGSTGRRFATRLRDVGDVNGDRYRDLLADTVAPRSGGRAYLIYGSRTLPVNIDVDQLVEEGGGVAIDILDGFRNMDWFNVSAAGDVNGDGFNDFLLGVEGGGVSLQGVTYLLFGSAALPPSIQIAESPAAPDGIVRITGEGAQEQAGRPGAAGDFNGDGYADFVIGAPGFLDFGREAGNVFLIFGSRQMPDRIDLRELRSHGLKIDGQNVLGGAGFFAGPAGDLNGDGLADFAFSENGILSGDVGYVYVIYSPFAGIDFIRGDANSDGQVNIADAISILGFLFLGESSPLCKDALDVDDGGSLEITDAISLLTFLFLGGPSAPPPPFPAPGKDPTPDRLGCTEF